MREIAGAGAAGSGEQVPTWVGLSQDCPGGQDASAQHTSSTQLPETQSAGSEQEPPFGFWVPVGVTVGVLVGVAVGVLVGVAVGVLVGDGELVGVDVGVFVGVDVGVFVGVSVGTVLLMYAVQPTGVSPDSSNLSKSNR